MQESNSINSFTWKDLFYDCIAHWKWFLLSIAVCVSAAMYKIASSNEIYEATASILIKTEDTGNSLRQAREAFNMMGFGSVGSNVHNEMLTLSSPTLMAEVVEQLRLNEVFTTKEGLKTVDLYKREPVMVMFGKQEKKSKIIKMDITIKSHSEYELTNFQAGNVKSENVIIAKPGSSVKTPIGTLTISPSQFYSDEMVDKTIHYMYLEPLLMAESYSAGLSIELPDREASVINMTCLDASPVKAIDLISTLIDIYNKNWVVSQNAKMKSISEMINERIDLTLKQLNDAEIDISSYMSKTLVSDFSQASHAYFSQNLELNKEIMTYRTQVNIAKSMLATLSESDYITLPANTGLTDNSVVAQIQEYNRLILERNKLLSNTGANNAVVADMTKSMQSIRQGVIQSLKGLINNTNMIVSSLEKQMDSSQRQLANTPKEARSLANVKREQKIKEELYLFLLEKKEENDMSLSFASDNSQTIVEPHSTFLPISPNKRLIIMAAVIISLVIPIAIIMLIALFDTTIHSKKDLESLKASYLGEIPLARDKKRKKYLPSWLQDIPWKKKEDQHVVKVQKNNRNIINESFRILRTKLDFMNKSGANKVFMVTSIQPGSGKSFVSMNLATTYALKGSKVLVVDMDLRRATASKYAPNTRMAKGLADYLSETDSSYKNIVIKDAIVQGLDMIPVGSIPPNPAELILSERLNNLLNTLRQEYDYIFLDCPPIDIVAESGEIARYADLAIFVVRAGMFEKAMLPDIDELYNKKVFNNMVVMLNAVTEHGHGYGKYGYGRYGKYGYGYHSYYSEKE